MATIGGHNGFGLFGNGDLREGTNRNFSIGTYQSSGGHNDAPYIRVTGGGGSGYQSADFIEVDTSKSYQMILYAKTFSRGSSGNLAGGHIGFSCYDKNYNFIDLRNCGDIGNTTLSRAASPGDSTIYLTSADGWYQGSDVTNHTYYFRQILFFPSSHPDYGVAHKYTRFNGMRYSALTQTGQGDWAMTLENGTLPNYGYSLPVGTPISRGVAGGSYNYALGAPNYSETWTKHSTPVFTGENRNSSYPFRYSTKYVKFLILRNYNRRSESPQDHVWGISKIFFGQSLEGKDYRNVL